MQAAAQPKPGLPSSSEERLLKQVTEFLEYFIDPLKSPEQQAALFARGAQYYDYGQVGSDAIIQDIKYFSRRWPEREYRLSKIHYITPDLESDRIFVSYEIEYHVAGRTKSASGTAHYGAVLLHPFATPKIEWIKENIERK